ncbi:ABC transporter permease [Mangrovimonas aestuarii]|uniref:ABC transporter permease n=1 Tax=Mangrovimonas aestuarii TaxID=3018443 RepID=UPI002378C196|nr:ABC transporter permease [Mangrovimonas aestuarii]
MKSLVKAEILKMTKQSHTFYALGVLIVIEAVVLVSAYYQGNALIDLFLESLKESFYFKGNLLNGNLMVYLILNTLWFHLPLILMIIVSGTLTTEFKDKTLQTVFMQPVNKKQFLLSKYIVGILFTILSVLILMLTSFSFSYLIFGQGDLIVYLETLNFFESKEAGFRLIMAFLSGTLTMIFFSVVSLTLAVFLEESAKTWIVAVLFVIVSNVLYKMDFGNGIVNEYSYMKLNNTWQYFFEYKIDWGQIVKNSVFLVIYTFAVMGIGIYGFNRKDLI